MKKLLIICCIFVVSSCSDNDTSTSRAVLSKTIMNNNIYSIDPFNHIVWDSTGIYHYYTSRYCSNILYKFKIK